MPLKFASSARSAADKENEAPTMANHIRRRAKTAEEEGEDEEVANLMRTVMESHRLHKRPAKERGGSSSSTRAFEKTITKGTGKADLEQRGPRQSADKVAHLKTTAYSDDIDDAPSQPAQETDDRKLEDVVRELEEVQEQLDDLRQLRMTEPERLCAEWKKGTEQKDKETEQYIATLKHRLTFDARQQSGLNLAADTSDANEVHMLRKQMEEGRRREEKLREESARLFREVEKNRLQSGPSTSALASRSCIGSGQLGAGDERAVRRLYEDLTGIIINNVERIEGSGHYRRFHAIFACNGYHDLALKLEESNSDLPSVVPGLVSSGAREDLVYTPTLDVDRDAELLQSGRLPSFLKDSIRFERATAVKFMSTLHKKLDRDRPGKR